MRATPLLTTLPLRQFVVLAVNPPGKEQAEVTLFGDGPELVRFIQGELPRQAALAGGCD